MIKNYYKSTPVFWRKFGDALLSVSSFITAYGIAEDNVIVAYSALAIGVAGKFLTNLFSE